MRPILDGKRFGRWTVSKRAEGNWHHPRYICTCDCGMTRTVRAHLLRGGQSQSCGCLAAEQVGARGRAAKQHGDCANKQTTPIYDAWKNMRRRCSYQPHPEFHNYGGRGISVCERWQNFENFKADMNPRPDGHSIERIDNNGNYEPSNCRWVPRNEQPRNTRRTKFLTLNGRRQCLSAWSRERGIPLNTLAYRVSKGWTAKRALANH